MGGLHHLQQAAGLEDSLEEAQAYLDFLAGGAAIQANLDTYVREGPAVLKAFMDIGVELRVIEGLTDHYYPDAPGAKDAGRTIEAVPIRRAELGPWADLIQQGPHIPPGVSWTDVVAWGGTGNIKDWPGDILAERTRDGILGAGQGLVGQLLANVVRRDVAVLNDFAVETLIVEDGRVVGVRGARAGVPAVLRARRGVILATGGYEGDQELVQRFEGLPDWMSMFPETITGDGFTMGTEIGAAIYRIPENLGLFLGIRRPGENPTEPATFYNAGNRGLAFPHSIVVNRTGRRFADESRFQHMVPEIKRFDPATHDYVNLPAFFVFDSQYAERYPFAGRPMGTPLPDWLDRDDTVAGLARKLGIAPDGLAATVARFNDHAAKGEDTDFARGTSPFSRSTSGDASRSNSQLGPLERPPYYGLKLHVSGIGSAGLLTDTLGRAIHVRGHPIPGLYACGNTSAPTDWGVGYQAGLSLMSGLIFAYRAVQHASDQTD